MMGVFFVRLAIARGPNVRVMYLKFSDIKVNMLIMKIYIC